MFKMPKRIQEFLGYKAHRAIGVVDVGSPMALLSQTTAWQYPSAETIEFSGHEYRWSENHIVRKIPGLHDQARQQQLHLMANVDWSHNNDLMRVCTALLRTHNITQWFIKVWSRLVQ